LVDSLDLHEYEDDQAVLSGLLYHFPDVIQLDYEQELFGNNQWPDGLHDGCMFDFSRSKDVTFLEHIVTGASPLVLHTSGRFYDCLDYLTDKLGGQSEARYIQEKSISSPPEDVPIKTTEDNSKLYIKEQKDTNEAVDQTAYEKESDTKELENDSEDEELLAEVLAVTLHHMRKLKKRRSPKRNYAVVRPGKGKKRALLRRLIEQYQSEVDE
jgi:hypothetical protein